MNKLHWAFRTLLFFGLLQIVSCTKNSDSLLNESLSIETSDDATTASEFPTCKLRRINSEFPGMDFVYVTGLFTYNKAGNPISLIFDNNGTGNPNHYWYYDNQNRLIEWRKTYQNGTVIAERHRYVYNDAGVAVQDTAMFIEGDTVINVYTFTYDTQGRIVRENIKNIWNAGAPLNAQRNPTYTYDARGNLGVLGWKSSYYDYKVNPLRTHPVFQFIHKNWSRNNSNAQPKYNSKGLPLQVQNNNDVYFNRQTFMFMIYDCQ